jgi:putative SOS response-associated peptidase YedK
MCGRAVLSSPIQRIIDGFVVREWFEHEAGPPGVLPPRYNVAPTDPMLTIRVHDGRRRLEPMGWGFRREWTPAPIFNARDDKLESDTWIDAFRGRRCLVIVDGFYEWPKKGEGAPGDTQARFISLKSGKPMGLAGLYEEDPEIGLVCTVCTTRANELLATIPHPRMPVILPKECHEAWLDPGNTDTEALLRMIVPTPATLMQMVRVGPHVNRREDGPQCIEGTDGPEQLTLFA